MVGDPTEYSPHSIGLSTAAASRSSAASRAAASVTSSRSSMTKASRWSKASAIARSIASTSAPSGRGRGAALVSRTECCTRWGAGSANGGGVQLANRKLFSEIGRSFRQHANLDYRSTAGHSAPGRRTVMKACHWMVAVVGIAFALPAPASAAVGDQEVIIYRFPGVLDNGGGTYAGVATLFLCTTFGGQTETIRFVTRSSSTTVLQNSTISIPHLVTRSAATHGPYSYGADLVLATGAVYGGTTAIAATSINI